MKQIYKSYFQKSKVFLYPLLGIKKGIEYVPIETYITWGDNEITPKYSLICIYLTEEGPAAHKSFQSFAKYELQKNELYHSEYERDTLKVFTFDLSFFKSDIENFKKGKYSEFSTITKKIIMDFFGNTGTIGEYMESYLYPEKYYEVYSKILKVSTSLLEEVKELCDKPDLKKEDFKKHIVELELFK
tara:strand:- start:306 stop:866 length:561 start_codon:yes stop_codon:yes gene_type:complete